MTKPICNFKIMELVLHMILNCTVTNKQPKNFVLLFFLVLFVHKSSLEDTHFHFYCAGMSKQNHRKQIPMYSISNIVHRTIVAFQENTWVTDGGMLYQIVENELYS